MIDAEEEKFRAQSASSGIKIPEKEEGKGILMKFLEFDMSFWQRLILHDILNDVAVKKPYRDSFSVSHNYRLLLPFFEWLSPENFPNYLDKDVDSADYYKIMVERMKNFINGNIS